MKKYFLFIIILNFFGGASWSSAEEGDAQFSEAELEQILAPIALYPDSVLTHILIASTYPIEIIQADRWVKENPQVDSTSATDLIEKKNWDASIKALIPFPKILDRMSSQIDWTQKLGDAFLQDESRLLTSIQTLRSKADEAGNLDKMEYVDVNRTEKKIIIEAAEPEVVYVPVYDTREVYGAWSWIDYPPVYWGGYYPRYSGLYYWGSGIRLSYDYFYYGFNWNNYSIFVSDRYLYGYGHDRYNHGRSYINTHGGQRWTHNPRHRRGVAYRSETIRHRYNSNRVSTQRVRVTRSNERVIRSNRLTNAGSNRNRISPSNTREDRLNQRISRASVSEGKPRTANTRRGNNRSTISNRRTESTVTTRHSNARGNNTRNNELNRRSVASSDRLRQRTTSGNRANPRASKPKPIYYSTEAPKVNTQVIKSPSVQKSHGDSRSSSGSRQQSSYYSESRSERSHQSSSNRQQGHSRGHRVR